MEPVLIIPAILTDSPKEARELLSAAERAAERVQIDIVDGVFAKNKTIEPIGIEGANTNLSLDFHLMVDNPTGWVEKCIGAGADRIIGHVEMMDDQDEFVDEIIDSSILAGLAVDIDTPLSEVHPGLLKLIDVVLLMSYPAGVGGQAFDKRVLAKIETLSEMKGADGNNYKICVDGAITEETVGDVVAAGADEVAVGRRIFDGDIMSNVTAYEKAARGK